MNYEITLSILFLVSSILLYFPFGSSLEFPILQCTILVEVEPADALRDVSHAGLFICNLKLSFRNETVVVSIFGLSRKEDSLHPCNLCWVGWVKKWAPGLVNFVPSVAFHFCLNLPEILKRGADVLAL